MEEQRPDEGLLAFVRHERDVHDWLHFSRPAKKCRRSTRPSP
jgi:hypothetical protein